MPQISSTLDPNRIHTLQTEAVAVYDRLNTLAARQQKLIRHLENALERIENKTYGVCRVSGRPIARERLVAVPHTETSIEAKRDEQRRR